MLRRALLALLLVVLGAIGAAAADRLEATVLERPLTLPEFALADQNGAPFTLRQLKGHWSLVTIGYTSCPDICPFTLANLNSVLETAAAQGSPNVAVDPARDKPALKQWIEQFNPHFVGVTGEPAQIETLVTALGGVYRLGKPDASGWYSVAHSAAVAVIDPEARLRARLLPPMPPKETAGFLARLMSERSTPDAGGMQ
jgi:protein SCO1